MATSTTSAGMQTRMEDALSHLPVSSVKEFRKGQTIYGPNHPADSLHLVVAGNVGISHVTEDGSEVLLEIVRPEELFGEEAFLDTPRRSERAIAVETAKLMSWTISEVEDLIVAKPRLAMALLQIIAQRSADYRRRIGSFAIDTREQRLARSLLRLSDRLGTREESGAVTMMPLTHEMLSRYIGTSREVVTQYMNRFRKMGYVTYSRQGIRLQRDPLKASIS